MSDIIYEIVRPPLGLGIAWDIESFLLEIFEYFDFSLRRLVRGNYNGQLESVVCVARRGERIVGAAVAMWSCENKSIAMFGPVGVDEKFRGKGVGDSLVAMVLEYLRDYGIGGVYLGVKEEHPAVRLYERYGFVRVSGVVMRKVLNAAVFGKHFACDDIVTVRKADYKDWCGVQALVAEPFRMISVDYSVGLFSSRYVQCERFTSVFSGMMRQVESGNRKMAVMVKGDGAVVGLAGLYKQSKVLKDWAFDFYVADVFLDRSLDLVEYLVDTVGIRNIVCYCLEDDRIKINLLGSMGVGIANNV